jgi:myosin-light-chain kinase
LFLFSIGGGELFDRVIEDEFVLTEKACIAFMKQILEGVAYMHSEQIIHLDLKVIEELDVLKLNFRANINKLVKYT